MLLVISIVAVCIGMIVGGLAIAKSAIKQRKALKEAAGFSMALTALVALLQCYWYGLDVILLCYVKFALAMVTVFIVCTLLGYWCFFKERGNTQRSAV